MKLVLLVSLAFIIGCDVHHKSEDYACTTNADCDMGRVCNNGFCIVAGSIDAPTTPSDTRTDGPRPDGPPSGCPQGCTGCNMQTKTCTINCLTANCSNTVTCPTGWHCDIQCNTDNSCRNGINCQLAASCNIDCIGKQSCQNVECGPGRCDVSCSGMATCKGVDCNTSCACDVTCTGTQSCGDTVQCTGLTCDTGSGCTSQPSLCHGCQ